MIDPEYKKIFAYFVCFILGYMLIKLSDKNNGFSIGAPEKKPGESCTKGDTCGIHYNGKYNSDIAENYRTYNCPGTHSHCYDIKDVVSYKKSCPIGTEDIYKKVKSLLLDSDFDPRYLI